MCDTMIAMGNSTEDGSVIFGKNSDREPNEAQNVTFIPARTYSKNSRVQCTYIEIPQIDKTNAVLLSRPFWMFGAEMGVNEYGVVIGNEAVFTKEKYEKRGLLTGMDMLRLALERTKSAEEAQNYIIELLERYGQGGNCSMEGKLFYHNSFIIADHKTGFVLETADKMWVSKKVNEVATISNCLTIEGDYESQTMGIKEYAKAKGYLKGDRVNFKRDFSDPLITFFAGGRTRQTCSLSNIENKRGSITSRSMISMLRDHNTAEEYIVGKKPMKRICMHAGGMISSQSTGSMVVQLKKGYLPLVYITGTAAPCLSIFKPNTLTPRQKSMKENALSQANDTFSTDIYGSASKKYNPKTLWWLGEEIHRRIINNYPDLSVEWIKKIRKEEDAMIDRVEKAWRSKNTGKFIKECHIENEKLLMFYKEAVDEFKSQYRPLKKRISLIAKIQWGRNNKKAGITI